MDGGQPRSMCVLFKKSKILLNHRIPVVFCRAEAVPGISLDPAHSLSPLWPWKAELAVQGRNGRGLPGWVTPGSHPSHTGTKTGGQSQKQAPPPFPGAHRQPLWFLPSAGALGSWTNDPPLIHSCSSHIWTGAAAPCPPNLAWPLPTGPRGGCFAP